MDNSGVDLSIHSFSPRGFGLATAPSGKGLVEVAHAIPGDKVRVDLVRKRHKVQKGRLLELVEGSKDRIEPRCAHANLCGGCCWQAMSYEAQIAHKQNFILEAFEGLLRGVDLRPMIPCEDPWAYRNKMEFSFSENRAGTRFCGLMIAHAEPFVFNVERCHIAPEWMSECLPRIRTWWEGSGLTAYYPPQDRGSLRYLTLRESVRLGGKMAILNVSGNPEFALNRPQIQGFVDAIGDGVSTFLRIHQAIKGTPTRFFEMHLGGADHIVEELRLKSKTLRFKISPASFFQPNTIQAEKLYDTALDLLGECKTAYDLYCGTGTLGMAAAGRAKEVVGIELSPEAILDAEENAKTNELSNIRFHQGDVGKVLTRFLADPDFKRPDAVIVDPPRAGLDDLALHHLVTLAPKQIIYVSCNPLTQAPNIRYLIEKGGYRLEIMQAVDQFPHTAHIENVALLRRAN